MFHVLFVLPNYAVSMCPSISFAVLYFCGEEQGVYSGLVRWTGKLL